MTSAPFVMDLEATGPSCVENQPTQLPDDIIRSGDYQAEEVIGERGRILNIAEQFNDPRDSYVGSKTPLIMDQCTGPSVVESTPSATVADIACYEDNIDQSYLDAGHTQSLRNKFTAFEADSKRVHVVDNANRLAREIADGAEGGGVYENAPSMRRADVIRENDQDNSEAGMELQTRQMKDMWSAKETEADQFQRTTPAQVDLSQFDLKLTGEMRREQNKSASDNRKRAQNRWKAKQVESDSNREPVETGIEDKIKDNRNNTKNKWENIRQQELNEKHSSCQSINPAADIAYLRQLHLQERSPSPPTSIPTPEIGNGHEAVNKGNIRNKWNNMEKDAEILKNQKPILDKPKLNRRTTEQRWQDMRTSELEREADSVTSLRISSKEISDIRNKGLQNPEVEVVETATKPVEVAEPEPFVDSFMERRRRRNLASRQPIVRKKKEPSPPKVVAPVLTKAESIVQNRRNAEQKWMALRQNEEDSRKEEINSFKSYSAPVEVVPEPVKPIPKPQRKYGGGSLGFGNCYQSEKNKRVEEEAKIKTATKIAMETAKKPSVDLDSDGEPVVDKWSNISNLWGTSRKKSLQKQTSEDNKITPKTKNKPKPGDKCKTSLPEVANPLAEDKRGFRFRDNWKK